MTEGHRPHSNTLALDARPPILAVPARRNGKLTVVEGGTLSPIPDTEVDPAPPWAVRRLATETGAVRHDVMGDEEPTRPLYASEIVLEEVSGHRLVRKLGSDAEVGLWVAERLRPEGPSRSGFAKFLPRTCESYERARVDLLSEAQLASGFHHPSLLNLDFADEDAQGCLLVYDHVCGTNLGRVNAQLWDRSEALPLEVAVWIMSETLRGLHYLHTLRDRAGRPRKLVAGHLAPGQVLLTEGGHVCLATFALQVQSDDALGLRPFGRVTPYLAPECVRGAPRSQAADVYAVGAMLCELLTGRPLLPDCEAHQMESAVLGGELGLEPLDEGAIPSELAEVVRTALAPRPEDRYPDAAGLAAALALWMQDSDQHAMPSTIGRFLMHEDLLDPSADAYGPPAAPLALCTDVDSTRPTALIRGNVASMFPTNVGARPVAEAPELVLGPGTLSAMIISEADEPRTEEAPEPSESSPWSARAPITVSRPLSAIPSTGLGDGPTRPLGDVRWMDFAWESSISAIYVLDSDRQKRLTAALCLGTLTLVAVLLLTLWLG